MLQCNFCSATFQKLQHKFCFRLWHVAGVGFRGVGFRGVGFRGVGFIGVGFRGVGCRGVGFRTC